MKVFLFLLIFLSATPVSFENTARRYFVVWNIGQGQWTSFIDGDSCRHFDMGGESFPWKKIEKQCAGKKNLVSLSHWDWDHIGALAKAPKHLPELCLVRGPLGDSTLRKEKLLPKNCENPPSPDWQWIPPIEAGKSTNDLSQVYLLHHILIPGDSPQKAEKAWAQRLPGGGVKILVLGHHGSRTSTSDFLLSRLPRLQMAVATARWSRYHHPHAETIVRLRQHHVPLLKTEDWGSIWFEQP